MTDAAIEEVRLLTLSEPLPEVVDTPEALSRSVSALAAGTGPVSIDAERASGYRYSAKAYLIQLRRAGSGTHLIDSGVLDDLSELAALIEGEEWILHAATQDLPCLREVGLHPTRLFDTELAGRLLGYPRVGLATLVEEICGQRMRKEHSAADWSTRPLPESWLEYAALDVEVLDVIREHLAAELVETGKDEWARQEFEHLLGFQPVVRAEPWRRTSQLHRIRQRRGVAAVRELWLAREAVAKERDVAPSRLLPDSAIIAAAKSMPQNRQALLATDGFHGRGAARFAAQWLAALKNAAALPESELPRGSAPTDAPPPPRAWAAKDPAAAARLVQARAAIGVLSEEVNVPVENLMTPETVRRVLWRPPTGADLAAAMSATLTNYGARQWQIDLVAPILVEAIAGQ